MKTESNEPSVEPEVAALPTVTSSCHRWTAFARKLFLEAVAAASCAHIKRIRAVTANFGNIRPRVVAD